MYAVIEVGSKQYRVVVNDKLCINLVKNVKEGEELIIDRVLMIGGKIYQLGKPLIQNVKVYARVIKMNNGCGVKSLKIKVFKKKRRQGYHKMIGHRQKYTHIQIKRIEME